MEPVASIVSAIFKALQAMEKAEREARRNRTRCRDLAERARVVSSVLRDARSTAGTRRVILCMLREALDDALKLVESCARRDKSLWPWFSARIGSGARAARFDGVDKRISNCLLELNAASSTSIEKKIDRLAGAAALKRRPLTNKNKTKETKAGNAPQNGAVGQGGGNGGKRRRAKNKKKGSRGRGGRPQGPHPPPPAHAGVPFHPNGHRCTVHHRYHNHHHCSGEEDLTSYSVM